MNIHLRANRAWDYVFRALLIGSTLVTAEVFAQQAGTENYDVRDNPVAAVSEQTAEQKDATDTLRQKGAKVSVHRNLGVLSHVTSARGFLSGPDAEIEQANKGGKANVDLDRPIKQFLKENSKAFGHGDEVLSKARKKREFVTAHNGMRTVTWEQEFENIPVFEGVLTGHITKKGELVSISSLFVPDTDKAARSGNANWRASLQRSAISPEGAVSLAAVSIGENVAAPQVKAKENGKQNGPPDDAEAARARAQKRQRLNAPGLKDDVEAKLVWFPIHGSNMRLAWCVGLISTSTQEGYQILVDAETGEILLRQSLTSHASPASYRIFPGDSPTPMSPGHATPSGTQPALVSRVLTTLTSIDSTASPLGWINDGDTTTKGNNVDARARAGYDAYGAAGLDRPVSATRVFDFSWSSSVAPVVQWEPATVQLFYWCNWMHDKLYQFGFTEPAGNFQADNFGRGGQGNDAVVATAQAAFWVNNASFYTPPDDASYPYDPYMAVGRFPTTAYVFSLAAGSDSAAEVRADGTVWTRGGNSNGQLGDGTTTPHSTPAQIPSFGGISELAAGDRHYLALKGDGTVWAWGKNANGQLGDGTTTDRSSPVQVTGLDRIWRIAAGANHSAAARLNTDYTITLWMWGNNSSGQLGDGTTTQRTTPVQVPGLSLPYISWGMLALGGDHSAAVHIDGTFWTWGNNAYGQLGDGTTTSRSSPVQISGINNVQAFALGGTHTLVQKFDGTVVSCGNNTWGQLGDGTTTSRSTFAAINVTGAPMYNNPYCIAAGIGHSMLIKGDGSMLAWGRNANGQLGDNTTTDRLSPVAIKPRFYRVHCGGYFSTAIVDDYSQMAWGQNNQGQVGDGTTTDRLVPQWIPSGAVGRDASFDAEIVLHEYTHGLSNRRIGGGVGLRSLQSRGMGEGWSDFYALSLLSESADDVNGNYAYGAYSSYFLGGAGLGYTTNYYYGIRRYPYTTALSRNPLTFKDIDPVLFSLHEGVPISPLFDPWVGYGYDPAEEHNQGEVWCVTLWDARANLINKYGFTDGNQMMLQLVTDGMNLSPANPTFMEARDAIIQADRINNDGRNAEELWRAFAKRGMGVSAEAPVSLTYSTLPGLREAFDLPDELVQARKVLAATRSATAEVKPDGTVWTWGHNQFGELGDGFLVANRSTPGIVSDLTDVIAIAGGGYHFLALKRDGTLMAWGFGSYGQIGDGGTTTRYTPVAVSGISNVVGISAGDNHSVALKSDGTVWAWGHNAYGQLGDTTSTTRTTPVRVTNLTAVAEIASGYWHNLARKADGTVWAWGGNFYGAIGDGTTTDRFAPVQVALLDSIMTVEGNNVQSFAVRNDGSVWAWGYNGSCVLGDETSTDRYTPVRLTNISDVVSIDGGHAHTVALKYDGTVWAWGWNGYGSLGDGTTIDHCAPAQVTNLNGIVAIAAGSYHTIALRWDGTNYGWGYNTSGQLGDGSTTSRSAPVPVSISAIIPQEVFMAERFKVSAGYEFSVALSTDGAVWTWGRNELNQLGDGTNINRIVPRPVNGVEGIVSVVAGYGRTLALRGDGTVWAWGYNANGEVGDGTTVNKATPVQVLGLSGITAIAGNGRHSLALKSDGTVWAWGYGAYGQIGDGTNLNRLTPVQVPGLSNVVSIGGGGMHSLAARNDGTVWAWGYNAFGQLGDTTTTGRNTPVQVSGLSLAVSVSAGYYHSLALKADGTVVAWGYNNHGQLGDGTTANRTSPVAVIGLADIVNIDGGLYHSAARNEAGVGWVWGYNLYGMLGDGTTTDRTTAIQVPGLNEVTFVSAGYYHTLLLQADGTLWASGKNAYGTLGDATVKQRLTFVEVGRRARLSGGGFQSLVLKRDGRVLGTGFNGNGELGDGSTNSRWNPTMEVTNLSGVVTIVVGENHGLAAKDDGTVWAWGLNNWGQLGDGTTNNRTAPVQVSGLYGIVDVAAGFSHSLALRYDGTVWAWGNNNYGQVGDNTTTTRLTPVQVLGGLSSVVGISGGSSHSVAVKLDGTVWAWGGNWGGQVGDGTMVNRLVPVQSSGLSGIADVSAGYNHSIALTTGGLLKGWGENGSGQIGDGTTSTRYTAVSVTGISNVIAISAGGYHTLAIKNDGVVWAWGANWYNQLGDGTTTQRTTPVVMSNMTAAAAIDAGSTHSLIMRNDGYVWAVGFNNYGQLGVGPNGGNAFVRIMNGVQTMGGGTVHGTAVRSDLTAWSWGTAALGDGSDLPSAFAWQATNLNNVVGISGGAGFTLAVRNDGSGWAWGENYAGKFGAGLASAYEPLPKRVTISNLVAASAGAYHSLFLKNDGTMWAAGDNSYGQLGVGLASFSSTNSPVQVSNITGFAAISAGYYHNLALHSNGTVWAWGRGELGTLGDGGTNYHTNHLPMQVVGLSNIVAIDTGAFHGLALRNDGRVMAWGPNFEGRLGDGTTNHTGTPVFCVGLSNIVSITTGGWFSQAANTNGDVFSWGYNGYGGVGDGTTVDKMLPTLLTTIKDVKRVKAGFYDGFALKKDNTLWGWGVTDFGELGDGTVVQRNSPVLVGIRMYLNAMTPGFKL
jgi:alpha-tubulin suppressor-like RCC1 family protein